MQPTVALVIGVSKYQTNQSALPAAQIDALHFARALTHWGVTETTLLLNEEATLEHINEWLKTVAKRNDDYKLLFYFCGHGERLPGAVPSSNLLLFDGRIHLDTLINQISQSQALESYIFIDACSLRINSLTNPKLEEESKGYKISHRTLFCLLSSGIEESFENNCFGFFTDALLRVLATSRNKDVDASQFYKSICNLLKMNDLPLPEMYNIGTEKVLFLPPLPPFFNSEGLLYRPSMVGKIGDELILNRGKIGILIGETRCGKTSLCPFLESETNRTFYLKIPEFDPLLECDHFDLHKLRGEQYTGSLVLLDQAENLPSKHLTHLIEELKNSSVQLLLLSNQPLDQKISLGLKDNIFVISIDPLSSEEGEHLMLPYSTSEEETELIYFATRGDPAKMRQVAQVLTHSPFITNPHEHEELLKTMSAIYSCGGFLDKALFAKTFNLLNSSITLIEDLGLIIRDIDAWIPHQVFYEIAESQPLQIDRDKTLTYWCQQIKLSPNAIRAAQNLIYSAICLGYEKKVDPFLKSAFKLLEKNGKDHIELLGQSVELFKSLPKMTGASSLLAEILSNLQMFDLANQLRQGKTFRKRIAYVGYAACILLCLGVLFLRYPFQTTPLQLVNLKHTHPDFVGRDFYINQLKKFCLKQNKVPPVTVLWGETGIGKSEIAIAFANSQAKKFRLICWIDGATEESCAASYYDLAEFLKIPVDREKDIVGDVHRYLEREKSIQPWLLILDNASKKTELPTKGNGSIIITTKNRSAWQTGNSIEVVPFLEEEAVALFKKITNCKSNNLQPLIHELDLFPLTLNLAAHYIAETPEMNEELYLKLLSQNNVDLISNMPLDERYPIPLISSWNITASELAKKNLETLHWLHFCSYLSPTGIPSSWVEKWLVDIQKIDTPFEIKIRSGAILRNLVNQCHMRFDKNTHTLSLHHLKQSVMKKDRYFQKEVVDQVAQFLINCCENLEKIYEGKILLSQQHNLREWEPHAAWFLNKYSYQCSKEKIATLQNLLGNWKYLKGNYKASEHHHKQSLDIRIDLFGEGHPLTIVSMNNLAMILWENGLFAESKQLFRRALEASKKLYKEDHLDVIITLNNLGWVCWEMGQFQEAKALLNQSLKLSKKLDACDPDFLQTVDDFLNFLDVGPNQDKDSEIKEIKRASFLRHAGLWIAEVEGNPGKSLSYFKESLELLKKVLPKDDTRLATAYCSVGISLNRADRNEEGRYHLAKALKLQIKALGEEHPDTAKSYANLAISLFNLGNYQQALEYHLKALQIRKKTLGEEHSVTAKSYSGTGTALLAINKCEDALYYNKQALEIRKKILGENHSETAQSYSRLGINLGKLGRHKEALDYNLKALEILRQIFEENHFLIARVHMALGICYKNLGLIDKALYHEQKGDEIRKLINHP